MHGWCENIQQALQDAASVSLVLYNQEEHQSPPDGKENIYK